MVSRIRQAASRRTASTCSAAVTPTWALNTRLNWRSERLSRRASIGYLRGQTFNQLAAVCVILPLALGASRAWGARRGRVEVGLLRHPLRREVRAHLLQGLNIWLCCALLGGVLAAGGLHFLRVVLSFTAGQLDVVLAAFAAGLPYWRRWRWSPAAGSTPPPTW